MECPDRELELVRVIHKRLEVRNRVAMCVNVHMAAERGAQGLPLEILGQVPLHAFSAHRFRPITPIILILN